MGLTIHYKLAAPNANMTEARRLVSALRQRCLDLPFKEVGEVVDLTGEACDRRSAPDNLRWLLIQAISRDEQETPQGMQYIRVPPERVIAFRTLPGDGCEEANVGLCLYPDRKGWGWSSFCKTQYANDPRLGGFDNFLKCHLSVVAMLDAAKELGLMVEVSDEGGFWDKRDVGELAGGLGRYDTLVAAAFGAIKDATGGMVVSPMSQRPDFERLEHEGKGLVDPKLIDLIRKTARMGEPNKKKPE